MRVGLQDDMSFIRAAEILREVHLDAVYVKERYLLGIAAQKSTWTYA